MFKFLFFSKSRTKGIIGYLGLESFWGLCTPQEQEALTRYYQGGLGESSDSSPVKGDVSRSSLTKFGYFSAMVGWAVSEKNYSLADKIINEGKDLTVSEDDLLVVHFFCKRHPNAITNRENAGQTQLI